MPFAQVVPDPTPIATDTAVFVVPEEVILYRESPAHKCRGRNLRSILPITYQVEKIPVDADGVVLREKIDKTIKPQFIIRLVKNSSFPGGIADLHARLTLSEAVSLLHETRDVLYRKKSAMLKGGFIIGLCAALVNSLALLTAGFVDGITEGRSQLPIQTRNDTAITVSVPETYKTSSAFNYAFSALNALIVGVLSFLKWLGDVEKDIQQINTQISTLRAIQNSSECWKEYIDDVLADLPGGRGVRGEKGYIIRRGDMSFRVIQKPSLADNGSYSVLWVDPHNFWKLINDKITLATPPGPTIKQIFSQLISSELSEDLCNKLYPSGCRKTKRPDAVKAGMTPEEVAAIDDLLKCYIALQMNTPKKALQPTEILAYALASGRSIIIINSQGKRFTATGAVEQSPLTPKDVGADELILFERNAFSAVEFAMKETKSELIGPCVDVPSDGNCFFHAVLYGLRKLKLTSMLTSPAELRTRAVAYLRAHPEMLSLPLELNDGGERREVSSDEYLTKMAQDGFYAEGPIIDALAKVLNVHFNITELRRDAAGKPSLNPLDINDHDGQDRPKIGLVLEGLHYMAEELPEKNTGAPDSPRAFQAAAEGAKPAAEGAKPAAGGARPAARGAKPATRGAGLAEGIALNR